MYAINEKVVHSPEGVCVVENICEMKIDKQMCMMYKLRPVVDQEKVLYIPIDSNQHHIRSLKSREEIEQLLSLEPDEALFVKHNYSKRISIQNHAIYEDNSILLMKLVKLYIRRKAQSKLSIVDKNWLKVAEQFIFSEAAEVLECEYNTFLQNSYRIICCA